MDDSVQLLNISDPIGFGVDRGLKKLLWAIKVRGENTINKCVRASTK